MRAMGPFTRSLAGLALVLAVPAADAPAEVAAALTRAREENRRVLVVFGADAGEASLRLDAFLREDPGVRRKLLYEYRVVKVAVGDFDRNMDLARRFEAALKEQGLPSLTVLSGDGRVLANRGTGDLREGASFHAGRVLEFLGRWQAEPWDARALLKGALEEAGRTDRNVLVHLGAPW